MSESNERPWYRRTWDRVRRAVAPTGRPEEIEKYLAEVRSRIPTPTFWLFGKTQSGKSSIVRLLTGADAAAIGSGFRPCTPATQRFRYPSDDMPLLSFLDTRGLGDPAYDPQADLDTLAGETQLMIVTARIADFAQADVIGPLKTMRAQNRARPVLLALTCLHELDPQNPHPQPYPFTSLTPTSDLSQLTDVSDPVRQAIDRQRKDFEGLYDALVVIDLTKPEEGFADPKYGAGQLKEELLRLLPAAYRQAIVSLDAASKGLKDLHLANARPVIAAYSAVAAAVAAVPIPFVDLLVLPAIQVRMVRHLAILSGREDSVGSFAEMAASLGVGLLARQAVRELAKVIPVVGSAVASAAAGASTYALGRAFCEYEQRVHAGHAPSTDMIRQLYDAELSEARRQWSVPAGTTP